MQEVYAERSEKSMAGVSRGTGALILLSEEMRILLVQEHCQSEARKRRYGGQFARAHCGAAEASAGHHAAEIVGKTV